MIEDLSDEELLAEWEKTKAAAGSAPGGPGPLPTYPEAQHRRHMDVEAELKRTGVWREPTRLLDPDAHVKKCRYFWVGGGLASVATG